MKRCAGWNGEPASRFSGATTSLGELAQQVAARYPAPVHQSGHQELLENLVNRYLFDSQPLSTGRPALARPVVISPVSVAAGRFQQSEPTLCIYRGRDLAHQCRPYRCCGDAGYAYRKRTASRPHPLWSEQEP